MIIEKTKLVFGGPLRKSLFSGSIENNLCTLVVFDQLVI